MLLVIGIANEARGHSRLIKPHFIPPASPSLIFYQYHTTNKNAGQQT